MFGGDLIFFVGSDSSNPETLLVEDCGRGGRGRGRGGRGRGGRGRGGRGRGRGR